MRATPSIVHDLCMSVTADETTSGIVETIFTHFLQEKAKIIWKAWKAFQKRYTCRCAYGSVDGGITIEYESCDDKDARKFIRYLCGTYYYEHDKTFIKQQPVRSTPDGTVYNEYDERLSHERRDNSPRCFTIVKTYFNRQGQVSCIEESKQFYEYDGRVCNYWRDRYFRNGNVVKTIYEKL